MHTDDCRSRSCTGCGPESDLNALREELKQATDQLKEARMLLRKCQRAPGFSTGVRVRDFLKGKKG